MAVPFAKTSFSSGEISPALYGHTDLARFHTAASTMRNMFVSFRGGSFSRAGTLYVGTSIEDASTGNPGPRVIPFQFSTNQGYCLEFGDHYLRFIYRGGYVLSAGVPYEIVSPYAVADLPLLKFTQSADVMSFAHPDYPPYDLARHDTTDWTLTLTAFGSTVSRPGGCAATATVNPSGATTPPTLPCAFAYEVTAINADGEESIASPIGDVTNSVDISATAGSIIITWQPVAGARNYRIYKAPTSYNTDPGNPTDALPVPVGALFGLVGTAFGTEFVDSNITADFSITPPKNTNPFSPGAVLTVTPTASSADWTTATVSITSGTGSGFSGQVVVDSSEIVAVIIDDAGRDYLSTDTVVFAGGGTSASATLTVAPQTGTYPGVVAYFQQRRVYAQSLNKPDTYWMSQPGSFKNFDSSIPVNDADAITGTPWAQQVNGIQWMISMPLGLVTFTGSSIQQVGASGSTALSPSSVTPANQIAAPQSSVGASATVPPIQVDWDILFAEHDNATVRALTYQLYFNTYTTADISWPSSHLLFGREIKQWAWCRQPNKLLWAVRDDGILLSLTWLKEQEVSGWARHDTQGQVVSICSVNEPPVDALYLVVRRVAADGTPAFFVERMDNRLWDNVEDAWCVDAAVELPITLPDATLVASSSSGPVTFTATAGVFGAPDVSKILRMGGGIATITGYTNAQTVTGVWTYPCQALIPNDPDGGAIPQPSGMWSLDPQVTLVDGLDHLIGKTVTGVADGIPISPRLVNDVGVITLDRAASRVIAGLGFTAQLQSVYLDEGQRTTQGQRKAIYTCTVRVEGSATLQIGSNQQDAATLSPPPIFTNWALPPAVIGQTATATYLTASGGTVQPLYTGDVWTNIASAWQKPGQVAVQQTQPLPLNVLLFAPGVLEGDTPEQGYKPRQEQRRSRSGAQDMVPMSGRIAA